MPFGFFVGLFSPSSQSQISMIESKTSRVLTPLYHAAFSFGSLVGAFSAFFTIRYVDSPILIFSITGTALIVGALLINKFGLDKSFENLEKTPKFKLPKNSILVFGILMMLNYATDEPINLTVANLITLGFSGFIFGPALVGYLAEYLSLTFNMYLLSVIWGLNGVALIIMMDRIKSSH